MPNDTPGVYVEDVSIFPPSVVQLETAIPAFIGYTEIAMRNVHGDLHLKPTKIHSILEYEQYFGGPQKVFGDAVEAGLYVEVSKDSSGTVSSVVVNEPQLTYLLYYAMRLFFSNGGGACYIVSVNTYEHSFPAVELSAGLMEGLEALKDDDEPTLIVIPEAVQLSEDAHYRALVQAVLKQCNDLRDRFAIFDLRGGGAVFEPDSGNAADSLAENNSLRKNRFLFGVSNLNYGAVYYPFIRSGLNHYLDEDGSNVRLKIDQSAVVTLNSIKFTDPVSYSAVNAELAKTYIVLPPSAAVAGAYVSTDRSRGVWKAPANVSLNNVIEPLLEVSHAEQEAMNVDSNSGKSVNVIRAFDGKGTLIWGARTLAGNDNEWRYVPVRRLSIMIEASLKKSTMWLVFEVNDANTWGKVRSMIENYLTTLWRDGALAGATASDAFYVQCGLGSTMTAQDILEGRINVEIGIAALRPAEFIVISFSQVMSVA